jgi:hypothetical protein
MKKLLATEGIQKDIKIQGLSVKKITLLIFWNAKGLRYKSS